MPLELEKGKQAPIEGAPSLLVRQSGPDFFWQDHEFR
jgi:hypothetical protein